jgi:hypothetical protein
MPIFYVFYSEGRVAVHVVPENVGSIILFGYSP